MLTNDQRRILGSLDMGISVSMGLTPGFSSVDKFGINPLVTTVSDPEDVWEDGGVYTFSDISDIDTLSSSDASDIGQLVSINGLLNDTTVGFSTGYAELNGQNKVLIYDNTELTGDPITFWRVRRLGNESDSGNDFVGIIYCYVDTAISSGVPTDITKRRAIVNNGNNQTLMAIDTIPFGKVGFLFRGEVGLEMTGGPSSTVDYARMYYQSRRYGKVFKIKKSVTATTTGTSTYQDHRSFPDIIPALTDIKITVKEVSDDMGAWATFDILLVDEEYFSVEYLQSIGQPS